MSHLIRNTLVLALALVSMATPCLSETPENYWDTGEGSEASPFEIWTAAHLHQMHTRTADYDKQFVLMADLDLDPGLPGNVAYESAVIAPHDGSSSSFNGTVFSGVFDGNGHVVANLTIAANSSVTYDKYKGLFGLLQGGGVVVRNLKLENASVDGGGTVGSLVGGNSGGSIQNCGSEGTVSGTTYVGGLVGSNTADGVIKSCYSTAGSSASGDTVGGLVGSNFDGSVLDCYSTGPVSGADKVGGLVGWNEGFGNDDQGIISNCYCIGSISSGGDWIGGLAGYDIGVVSGSFWDAEASGWGTPGTQDRHGTALATAEMQDPLTFVDADWDFLTETANGTEDPWAMPASGYPVLAWQAGAVPPQTTHTVDFDLGDHGTRTGGGEMSQVLLHGQNTVLPELSLEVDWVFTGWNGDYEDVTEDRTITATYASIDGDGTEGNPYQIATREHLEGVNQRLAAHYILVSDIDLDPAIPGNRTYSAAVIARRDGVMTSFPGTTFTGRFDGNGHVIRNFTITGSPSGAGDDYKGLFGHVSGTITDLGLEGISVQGNEYLGGLAGMVSGAGTVVNCHSTGFLAGNGYIGGLVGRLTDGSIQTSCAAGSVYSQGYYAGGLVGAGDHASVERCYSTCAVTGAASFCGGLVGQASYSTISECYSAGPVASSGLLLGGLVGYVQFSGTIIQGCFWDRDTSGQFGSSGGAEGKTTPQMQSLLTYTDAGWDFIVETANGSDDVWAMAPGSYPVLAWQDEAVPTMESHAVTFDLGVHGTRTSSGELEQIALYGQNAILPEFSTEAGWVFTGWSVDLAPVTSDVMVAAVYEALAGDGSEASPYQITNRQQLEAVNNGLAAHYRLVNDIDLHPDLPGNRIYQTAVIAPIYGPGFTGTFDGNGHVLHGLTIFNRDGANIGLFGELSGSGARIQGLGLENVDVTGDSFVGGLVGYHDGGAISDCYLVGSVAGERYVGGMVGRSNAGSIDNASSSGLVSGSGSWAGGLVGYNLSSISRSCSTASLLGSGNNCGGLVGTHFGGSIGNSWSAGLLQSTGNYYHGGLVGSLYSGTITACYSTSPVRSSATGVGGLIGTQSGGVVTASFWDVEASGLGASGDDNYGAIGKTTAQMQAISTFTNAGWDFVGESANGTDDIWTMPAFSYPIFPSLVPYTVVFDPGAYGTRTGGGELEQTVLSGQAAWPPEFRVATGRTFEGWDGPYTNVNGDLTITALYGALAGDGSEGSPYQITTRQELEAVNHDLGAHYILMNDIDLDPDLPGGKVYHTALIAPREIVDGAFSGPPFSGTFDGNGHVLRDLVITSNPFADDDDYKGLFGVIDGTDASVVSLGVEEVSVQGMRLVGAIAGELVNGEVSRCYATGTVAGTMIYAGGLIGANGAHVENCYSAVSVSGGGLRVGGLCGENSGDCVACYSTGAVEGNSGDLGGLIGYNGGVVTSCFWDQEASQVSQSQGGVGRTTQQMFSLLTFFSWTDGSWTINAGNDYPRLVWENKPGISISEGLFGDYHDSGGGTSVDPYVLSEPAHLMRLAGEPQDWDKSFVLGADLDFDGLDIHGIASFSGTFDGHGHAIENFGIVRGGPGALFGIVEPGGRIENLLLRNGALGTSAKAAGGSHAALLCGTNSGMILDADIEGGFVHGGSFVALLVAENDGTVANCSVNGSVRQGGGAFSASVGAIAGSANSTSLIAHCRANAQIDTGENRGYTHNIGGLCGSNAGSVRSSAAFGQVHAGDNEGVAYVRAPAGVPGELVVRTGIQYVGGLCGFNSGTIADCYSRASVKAGNNSGDAVTTNYGVFHGGAEQYLGGFAGYNGGQIMFSYSIGGVEAGALYPRLNQVLVQELHGFARGATATASFWDVNSSGMAQSDAGAGKTTAEMQTQATFVAAGWDFVDTWSMDGYPVLNAAPPYGSFRAWATWCPLGQRGHDDSPAGDGIPNIAKYAAGLPPMVPFAWSDLMTFEVDRGEQGGGGPGEGELVMLFWISKDATEVDVTPEWTDSLGGAEWRRDEILLLKIDEDETHETWEARLPMSGASRFMRLEYSPRP